MSASLAGFLAACSSDNGGGGTSPSATGASGATGAVVPGGTLKTGIIAPAGALDPLIVATRRASPSSARPASTSPGRTTTSTRAAPRRELDAERRRLRLDVQDPPGRHVPRRHAADGRRRRRHDEAPCGSEEQVERAVGVHRRALARAARRRSTTRPSSSRWTRRTATSRTWSAPTTTTRSSCRRRTRGLGEDLHRHRPVEARDVHARGRRLVRQEPRLLGHDPQPNADRISSRSTRRTRRRSWRCRAARSTSSASSRRLGARRCSTTRTSTSSRCGRRAPPGPHAERQGAVQRQAGAPGDGAALDRPAIIEGLFDGKADLGNDSPFAPVFPSTDTSVPQRAQDVEQAKQLLSEAGKPTASRHAVHVGRLRDPRPRAAGPEGAEADRDQHQAELTDAGTYYAQVLAGLDDGDHRLRPPRRAERVPVGAAHQRGHLERGALQEPEYDSWSQTTSRRSTSTRSRRSRSRSSSCCSTRRRSLPLLLLPPLGDQEGVAGVEATGMGHVDLTQAGFTA